MNLIRISNEKSKTIILFLVTIICFASFLIILDKKDSTFLLFASNCVTLVILGLVWNKTTNRLHFFSLAIMGIFLFICSFDFKNENFNRGKNSECITPLNHDHEYLQHLTTSRSYNVFFLETNNERTEFSTKQLCSIESATKANPNAQVFVMSDKARFNLNEANLCEKYSNLIQVKLNLVELFRDTPLLDWWSSRKVFKTKSFKFKTSHISDAARFAVLYKYGGFYSDLDTIALKSFDPLQHKSGPGYIHTNGPSVGSAVLHFAKNHPFLKYVMSEFQLKYNSNEWGANGPILIKKSLKSYCKFDDIFKELMNGIQDEDHKCKDLIIFPKSYFFPYTWTGELEKLFEKNALINVTKIIDSYSVHFFGALTEKYKVSIHDYSLYEYLATQHCPNVYEYVKKNGIKFY